ncbi:unnamed protein product [Anisakis simplex]|uniref:CACTA en-spm transposon protein n=1 Tax=Anisakis simplex TaxID=6269 RepID=A0A0M3K0R3_ANISI|nr:unnamed protein product [Anisakis simplex]
MINADEASEPRSEHQSTDAGLAKMLKEETVLGYEDDVAADNRKMLCEMNLEGLNQERMNSLTAKADEISSADANSIDPSESPESSVTCHAAINTPSSTTNHHIEKRHICVICGKEVLQAWCGEWNRVSPSNHLGRQLRVSEYRIL